MTTSGLLDAADGWRFVHPIEVRFRDMDAMGHVNNTVYLTYLESARIAYWLEVTARQGVGALDMILARTEIDYRRPVFWPDVVDVGVRCLELGRKSFSLGFRVVSRSSGVLVAEAVKVLVHYDWTLQQTSTLPDTVRAQLRAHDPGLVERSG